MYVGLRLADVRCRQLLVAVWRADRHSARQIRATLVGYDVQSLLQQGSAQSTGGSRHYTLRRLARQQILRKLHFYDS